MQVLIQPTTEARTVYPPFSDFYGNQQIAFIAIGLSLGESVGIEISIDGNTWELAKQYGATVALTMNNNCLGCYSPARIRIVKPVTVNPVSVAVSTKNTTQEN
jgi:hypothetical protein